MLYSILGCTELEIDCQNFCIKYGLFGYKRQICGKTEDIAAVKFTYNTLSISADNSFDFSVVGKCLIVEGLKTHQFGRYVSQIEKKWLVKEIVAFLGKSVID